MPLQIAPAWPGLEISAEIRERLTGMAIDPVGNTSEEFARIIAADIAKWTAVAKAANIKAD